MIVTLTMVLIPCPKQVCFGSCCGSLDQCREDNSLFKMEKDGYYHEHYEHYFQLLGSGEIMTTSGFDGKTEMT